MSGEFLKPPEYSSSSAVKRISNALRWVREIPVRDERRRVKKEALQLGIRTVFLTRANEWLTKSDVTRELESSVNDGEDSPTTGLVFEVDSFVDRMFHGGVIERRASYMGATLVEKVGEEPNFYRDETTAIDGKRMNVRFNRTPVDVDEMHMKSMSWTEVHYRYTRDEEHGDTPNVPVPINDIEASSSSAQ